MAAWLWTGATAYRKRILHAGQSMLVLAGPGLTRSVLCYACSPDGLKKAYVRLAPDYDALDVANKIGII